MLAILARVVYLNRTFVKGCEVMLRHFQGKHMDFLFSAVWGAIVGGGGIHSYRGEDVQFRGCSDGIALYSSSCVET